MDFDLLHRELASLASALSPDADLHEGLHRLTLTTAAALDVDGAGITLKIPGADTHYLTAADPVTLGVERLQEDLQEGACVDAIATSQIVAISDLTVEQRWPRFTPVLLDAGFRAAAGVPIPFQGLCIGAVDLYAKRSRAWTTEEFNAARLVAELAAGYLVNIALLRTTRTLASQLQSALDSRIVIEQAKGLMAGRHGITPDAAFELLRGYARSRRTKLRLVAEAIVSDGLDPSRDAAERQHSS